MTFAERAIEKAVDLYQELEDVHLSEFQTSIEGGMACGVFCQTCQLLDYVNNGGVKSE